MASEATALPLIGAELEHAIGFNGGIPRGVCVLPSDARGAASASDRFVVSTGACAVINSFTDHHNQVFLRGHRAPISAMALSPSVRAPRASAAWASLWAGLRAGGHSAPVAGACNPRRCRLAAAA